MSAIVAGFATVIAVAPAAAQFGSIFSDNPPRPPADVPGGGTRALPPPPPGLDQPAARPRSPGDQRPTFQTLQPSPLPNSQWQNPDLRPPSGIQSQPLAPPQGAVPPPQATRPANDPLRGAQQAAPPPQTLPGLPPGQRQPRAAPPQPADTAPQPGDEIVVAPPEQKIANPTAVFSGLDKITGRTITFDVAINETVQFGALQVTPRVCYTRPPTETPNTDAFVAVDEVTLQGDVKRIFSGWMFSASPGLNAVEHPIYDVWLVDCKGGAGTVTADAQTPGAAAAKVPGQQQGQFQGQVPQPPVRPAQLRRSNAPAPVPFR